MLDAKAFKRLVEEARKDPRFFHDLVFDPEKVLGSLDYMDRKSKGALVAIDPERVIGQLIGELQGCDVTCTSSCGGTCGESCGYTTNLTGRLGLERVRVAGLAGMGKTQWCDVTCTSSCGGTCGESCGYTTNLTGMGGPGGMAR